MFSHLICLGKSFQILGAIDLNDALWTNASFDLVTGNVSLLAECRVFIWPDGNTSLRYTGAVPDLHWKVSMAIL